MGWANWPPTSWQELMNLYGGTRRFLLVNVPALLIALGADFLGSFSAILSNDALRPVVRALRLDSVYNVFGRRRHYIDSPLYCTFSFPADWVYDPSLEAARYRRQQAKQTYSLASQSAAATPLPLVALRRQQESDKDSSARTSLAFYARPAGQAATLADAIGSPEAAQRLLGPIVLGYLPARQGREARAELLDAQAVPAMLPGERESYRLHLQVNYVAQDAAPPAGGDEPNLSWSVWTTAQLATADDVARADVTAAGAGTGQGRRPAAQQSYLLVLAGATPSSADKAQLEQVRAAASSLESLAAA